MCLEQSLETFVVIYSLQSSQQRVRDSWAGSCKWSIIKSCLCLLDHISERGSWTKSANVVTDQLAIVGQVWRCQAIQCPVLMLTLQYVDRQWGKLVDMTLKKKSHGIASKMKWGVFVCTLALNHQSSRRICLLSRTLIARWLAVA